VFLTAGVPSKSKMYETPVALEIHSVLHFVNENNTLFSDGKNHIPMIFLFFGILKDIT
jgi:hypothetical protein